MDTSKNINEFSVTIYGNLDKYNDVLSKARCRIFYKGINRNGSYISDEFAEKLLSTIRYAPIKGIYADDDYSDHGLKRSMGRIYGIVPEDPHVAWEQHEDEDGVIREYACVDVLLFTALYQEAGEIVGKAQSMELYDKTIKGDWQFINGQQVFVFTEGSFLGLQVLGEEVEPCFEGAGFFSLNDSLTEIIQKIEQYNLNFQKRNQLGGNQMPSALFKISDDQKFEMLWRLLNPETDEEGYIVVQYSICSVYDNYAVAFNFNSNSYERIYYEKDDEADSLKITDRVPCFIIDVTESEKNALDSLHKLNNDTYEKVDEAFANIENLTKENEEFGLKVEELNNSISTLTTERDEISSKYEETMNFLNDTKATLENVQVELNSLQNEKDQLLSFKQNVELKEKQQVLSSYNELLKQEILDSYSEKLDTYTAEELDKELAYELKKNNPSVFQDIKTPYIPKDNIPAVGIEAILSKYAK